MKKSNVYISMIMVMLLAFSAVFAAGCMAAFPEGQPAATGSAGPAGEVTPEPTVEPIPYDATAFFTESHLSRTVIETVDDSKVGTIKTIEIGGKKLELYYLQSVHADIGNVDFDEYGIVGCSEKSKVSLNQDGSINNLFINQKESLFMLDVSRTDGIDKIKEAAEELFKDDIDFDRYADYSLDESTNTLIWSNHVKGKSIGDSIEITLTEECSVLYLAVFKQHFDWDKLPDDLNLDLFMPLIEQTAKEYYGNDYKGCHVLWYSFTDTENLPSIRSGIVIYYSDGKGERTLSEEREVIVQFRLDDVMIG